MLDMHYLPLSSLRFMHIYFYADPLFRMLTVLQVIISKHDIHLC